MPGDSGVLVVTRVRSTTIIAHETAGATGTRRSPRPPWAENKSKPRAHRVARTNVHLEFERLSKATCYNAPSFPDVQVHIVDAPLGAGPESILPVVVMDSGLARFARAPE
jgi:hypothetical protein